MSLGEPTEASSTIAQTNGTTQKLLTARQNKLAKLGKQDGVDEEVILSYFFSVYILRLLRESGMQYSFIRAHFR